MTYKKIEDENSNFPDRWDWEKNPVFEGYYQETKEAGKLTFHEFKEFIGEKEYSFLGGVVLDKRLATCKKGDRLKITFKGMVKTKEGTSYKAFEVEKWEDQADSPETAF